jgi:hypothetical protein
VEEEEQSYSRVSVLAINVGNCLTYILIFNLFVGKHICWLIV